MADAKDILGFGGKKETGAEKALALLERNGKRKKGGGKGGSKESLRMKEGGSSNSNSNAPLRPKTGKEKEVYSLTGFLPTLVPTHSLALKKKRVVRRRAVPWVWRPFHSSAVSHHLRLYHWTKASQSPSADYPFSRFNRKVNIVRYTDEEYARYLRSSSWSRHETDHLLLLLQRFDMRFYIVADRLRPRRTVEEIKGRYYFIAKTVSGAREKDSKKSNTSSSSSTTLSLSSASSVSVGGSLSGASISATTGEREKEKEKEKLPSFPWKTTGKVIRMAGISEDPGVGIEDWKRNMVMFSYDAAKERERKKQNDALQRRSLGEVQKEEELVKEYKRIESTFKTINKDRKRVVKASQELLASGGDLEKRGRGRKRKWGEEREKEKSGESRGNRGGNFLRSTKIYPPATSTSKSALRIDAALEELSIPKAITPSARVGSAYVSLRDEVGTLIELHAQLARAEYQVDLLRKLVEGSSKSLSSSCAPDVLSSATPSASKS
eukprot:CAMPEP_0119156138 /NCGR_PEP_ID=MMETSP1310-20130426/52102_1 /TAXON_ID=464262 /ORGANISM="Genus nov. species nov., Strain RCC2339" /LENGTH=493 /DNA_ID=CAMNT_0007148747 /DNA_START=123 /DNA_END=1604 /DNA_ORIENTATION=-